MLSRLFCAGSAYSAPGDAVCRNTTTSSASGAALRASSGAGSSVAVGSGVTPGVAVGAGVAVGLGASTGAALWRLSRLPSAGAATSTRGASCAGAFGSRDSA